MTDEEAFLQAILDHPDDDTPRLIYADWLEERGDPRGEFIRVQCRLARLSRSDVRWLRLKKRERELLKAHGSTWLGSLRPLRREWRNSSGIDPRFEFTRGFVENVTASAEQFLKAGDVLFRSAPLLHRVRLHWDDWFDECLERSPYLTRLTWLDLADCCMHPATLESLLLALPLPRPATVDLWGEALDGPPETGSVAPNRVRLTALQLRENELGDAGVMTVARSSRLSRLITLGLGSNGVGDAGAAALADSPCLTRLAQLDLRGNDIGDAGAQALAASPGLNHLTALTLVDNPIGVKGRQALRDRFGGSVEL